MSQRISLLIHDLRLCQKSKQINKFRETLGVAATTAGSWKSASEFFKASLLLLSCYSNIAASASTQVIKSVHAHPNSASKDRHFRTQFRFISAGISQTVRCYFVILLCLFMRLGWMKMQPWFCVCVFIACSLVLQDNVLSNWGLLHPAGSYHGVEAPGNQF